MTKEMRLDLMQLDIYNLALGRRGVTSLEYALIACVVIVGVAAAARPIGLVLRGTIANLVAAFP